MDRRRRLGAGWRQGQRLRVLEPLESRCLLAVFWVATDGNDSQAGSASAPWQTLQHAADEMSAGDTVRVLPGSYQGFDLRTDGTAQAPIAFLAESGVLIDRDNPRTIDGINLEGADYVTIDGFEISGVTRAGIRSVVNQHVTLTNNHAHDNGRWGIFTGFSDDLWIEGNTTANSAVEHGIYVSNSADRPTIRNNLIYGNNANGIHLNGDASLGGDGLITEALIEGNVIYDNGDAGGSGINGDGLQDSIIRNNLIYNTHASGISLYRIDGGAPSTGNLVVGNTVVVASDGRWAMNIQNGSTGNTLLNNVFYNHHSFRGSLDISSDSLPGLVSDYNAVMNRFTTNDANTITSLSSWQANTGQDQHSFVSTPSELFVDPANGDFHLRPGSPAIDAGIAVAELWNDFEGDSRPQGSGYDIGADEFFELAAGSSVRNRLLFYNDSAFDGNDPSANANDDLAIAPDKMALLAGQSASFANYSSFTSGITGVMIDLAGRLGQAELTPADFSFRMGNVSDTSQWNAAPTPRVTVREGAGSQDSERIHLTWPGGSIVGNWLQVTIRATENTELPADDVFYFGNAPAETGNSTDDAVVNGTDFSGTRKAIRTFLDPAELTNHYDFNRDRLVDGTDLLLVREYATKLDTSLRLITPGGSELAEVAALAKSSPLTEPDPSAKNAPPTKSDEPLGGSELPREDSPEARLDALMASGTLDSLAADSFFQRVVSDREIVEEELGLASLIDVTREKFEQLL